MKRPPAIPFVVAHAMVLCAGCGTVAPGAGVIDPDLETSVALTNFSTRFYAVFALRETGTETFMTTPLLPPGATYRRRFLDAIGTGCPASLDLQLLLYRRINEDLPIGLDDGEQVGATPIVAGQITDLPACNTQPLEPYTIVSWDAPQGTARVKIAQGTPIDQAIFDAGLFDNIDNAWEITGLDPALAGATPPPLPDTEAVSGRVTLSDGSGLEGIGVLIRTRFRVRLNDDDAENDPDAGFGEPIDFTETDPSGRFTFNRPAGAYRIEVFSDDFAFRPAIIDVESPLSVILTVAEPL
ncbi:MAG: hypothetical protein ACE5GE_16515 [Phycisphaerae bacterium]